jgi:flavin reductase (DIM6/NTAB) family NADH-FMN oxidoreductase RutF
MATPSHDHPPIDPLALRVAFGTFLTGVTVITTRDVDGIPRGMTANSFTSVSLDPPLLLICVGKSATSFPAFAASPSFAVNVLHDKQTRLSAAFASKAKDKFENVAHDTVHTGAPILRDCLTWFDCSVHQRLEVGDHVVLIGRIQAFGTSPSAPLGFCRGRYAEVKDPLPREWSPSRNMIVGYIIEADGRILLRATGEGKWSLPIAKGPHKGRQKTTQLDLDDAGTVALLPDTTFLYSIFDVSEGDPGYIIYRGRLAASGEAADDLAPGLRFFPIDDLPLDAIGERDIVAMLRRYVHERSQNRFGIYVDAIDGGRVAMISDPIGSRSSTFDDPPPVERL